MTRALVMGFVGVVALVAQGCGHEVVRGSLAGLPPRLGPLGYAPSATLGVGPVLDARPQGEREGRTPELSVLVPLLVVNHWETRGARVTGDEALGAAAMGELRVDAIAALRSAAVARAIGVDDGRAELALELSVEHLYGTRYEAGEGTLVLFMARSRNAAFAAGGAGISSRTYGAQGSVVLGARLIDRRRGAPVAVWQEHVAGASQLPAFGDEQGSLQEAVREALADALATLAVRLGAVLDRMTIGPSGPGLATAAGAAPAVFLVERVSRYRDFLERVYIDTATARVLRHDVVPNADHGFARPGDWLLSRRTAEGVLLTEGAYDALGRALAGRYDLRQYDDAVRLHFFGALGTAVPASASSTAP